MAKKLSQLWNCCHHKDATLKAEMLAALFACSWRGIIIHEAQSCCINCLFSLKIYGSRGNCQEINIKLIDIRRHEFLLDVKYEILISYIWHSSSACFLYFFSRYLVYSVVLEETQFVYLYQGCIDIMLVGICKYVRLLYLKVYIISKTFRQYKLVILSRTYIS